MLDSLGRKLDADVVNAHALVQFDNQELGREAIQPPAVSHRELPQGNVSRRPKGSLQQRPPGAKISVALSGVESEAANSQQKAHGSEQRTQGYPAKAVGS